MPMINTPLISIVMFAVAAALGAVGQFLYKSGAQAADGSIAGYLLNPRILGGVVCYIAVMALFVAAFRRGVALAATSFTAGIPQRTLWVIAAALVQFRLACNMLDGMVAVESGVASPVGELYNEIPDRISDAAALIGLGYAAGGSATLGY